MDTSVIISRYNENLDWIKKISKEFDITVYNKGEKIEIEGKYNNLLLKYNELKSQVRKMEEEQKKAKRMQDKFNLDIEELQRIIYFFKVD